MQIVLTKGYIAHVDPEDYERINKFKWCANVRYNGYVRAARMKDRRIIYMHHEVLGVDSRELNNMEVDHIDRDPLNNRRNNLRIVTHAENGRNTLRHKNRIGYTYNRRASLWMVYLDNPGRPRRYLGYTKTRAEAEEKIREARL